VSFWGIVPAAGEGRRFGRSKHELLLAGIPLWQWARDCLLAAGAEEVVVVGAVPGGITGGVRRRDSVAAGLAAVPGHVAHVLVHDAARPLASADLAGVVVARLGRGDCAAVVPVVPVRDTIKSVDGEWVTATLDRSSLVRVQTPQGFTADALRDAHRVFPEDVTDDAALIERAGGRVAVVPGEQDNLKITFPEDLGHIEETLRRRGGVE
jgi:2-C-methyl-D-erythritol 4-phosphate cytidylyltransferase